VGGGCIRLSILARSRAWCVEAGDGNDGTCLYVHKEVGGGGVGGWRGSNRKWHDPSALRARASRPVPSGAFPSSGRAVNLLLLLSSHQLTVQFKGAETWTALPTRSIYTLTGIHSNTSRTLSVSGSAYDSGRLPYVESCHTAYSLP
jgi:hypothetical protein